MNGDRVSFPGIWRDYVSLSLSTLVLGLVGAFALHPGFGMKSSRHLSPLPRFLCLADTAPFPSGRLMAPARSVSLGDTFPTASAPAARLCHDPSDASIMATSVTLIRDPRLQRAEGSRGTIS